MTTVADFDPETTLNRFLDGMEEVVTAVNGLTVAVLTVDANDHRRATQLLREAIEIFTDPTSPLSIRDWIKDARQLVPPLDDPLPSAEEVRGIRAPEAPLPTIQRDDE